MKRFMLAAFAPLLTLAGCKSAFIDVDVRNDTGGPITVLEVDYPGGSFGKEAIASGADFHYRFKVFGREDTKVSWMDAAHTQHTYKGPELHEDQFGSITLALQPDNAAWDVHLLR